MSYKGISGMTMVISGAIFTLLFSNVAMADENYSFTVDGRTGQIAPDGKTYDDNGVYQGDYDFNTGVYTDHNGGSINVNNTPGVTIYTNNGAEVPKNPTPEPTPTLTPTPTPTPAPTSDGSYTFTVDGKTGRIAPDGKTYDNNGVYQGNYNFTTGVYTDNNGSSINVNNAPNVAVYTNNGVEVPKVPTTNASGAGNGTLQGDFQTYWKNAATGTVVNVGGGTVTRNADGTATYRNGNYSYTYSSSTPLDDVARNIPMLGQEWSRTYGYTLPAEVTNTGFTDFESYKAWERSVTANSRFASNYEVPDYIRMMGLSLGGGDDEAFKRYVFFKSNPQYAEDYKRINQGQLSRYETDMTTIIKTNLTTLPVEYAEYYKNNPADLRAAEGFGFDPVLARKVYTGEIKVPYGVNATTWLQNNKWTSGGVVANDNKTALSNAPYIGINGQGANNYVQLKFDTSTGYIVGLDGTLYDSVSGAVKGKVDPTKFYGTGATSQQNTASTSASTRSSTQTAQNTSVTQSQSAPTPTPIPNTNVTITIGYGNTYGLLLSESTANRLKTFTVKLVEKRSKYNSNAEYIAFLDKLSTKLTSMEGSTKYSGNETIKNSVQYLLLEIGKIRKAVSDATTTTTTTTAIVSDAQFVIQTYQNILNRAPEAAGSAYWIGTLTSGQTTRGSLPLQIACAAKNGPAGNDKTSATTWLTQNGKTCGN